MLTPLRDAASRLIPGIFTVAAVVTFDDQIVDVLRSSLSPEVADWWALYGNTAIIVLLAIWTILEAATLAVEARQQTGSMFRIATSWINGKWLYFSPYYSPEHIAEEIDRFHKRCLPDLDKAAVLSKSRVTQLLEIDAKYVQRIGVTRRILGIRRTKFLGYFITAGLSENGTAAILSGSVKNGHAITNEMIADTWENARSIYIFGAYAARTPVATAKVVSCLASFVHDKFDLHRMEYCFTRGGTERGRIQMRRYSFKNIDGSDIKYIDSTEVRRRWENYEQTFSRHAISVHDTPPDIFLK